MKRFVKKLNKEVEFCPVQITAELYEALRQIKISAKFKNMDETIGWLMNSTNDLLSKQENRDFLMESMGVKNDNR